MTIGELFFSTSTWFSELIFKLSQGLFLELSVGQFVLLIFLILPILLSFFAIIYGLINGGTDRALIVFCFAVIAFINLISFYPIALLYIFGLTLVFVVSRVVMSKLKRIE